MTPNVAAIRAELELGFNGLSFGVTNCRPIAGSTTWSQHAWSNALDIHGATTLLDKVYAWLIAHRYELQIRVILWRVKDHYDHIHVDPWPKGIGTPPCAGGKLQVRYQNGKTGDSFGEEEVVIKRGDKNELVGWYQVLINRTNIATITVDNDFGPATEAAVKAVQGGLGIPKTGQIDGALAGWLSSYSQRYGSVFDPTGVIKRGDTVVIK
jgi:hypothetical protein